MCTYGPEITFMFTVIFHDEAEKEFTALPAAIRAKWPGYS